MNRSSIRIAVATSCLMTLSITAGCSSQSASQATPSTQRVSPTHSRMPKISDYLSISASDSGNHVGEVRTVKFHVASTGSGSSGTEFLNAYSNYLDGFTAVVFSEDVPQFANDPISTYSDRDVLVTGTISTYQGRPQIIIKNPSQIRLAN